MAGRIFLSLCFSCDDTNYKNAVSEALALTSNFRDIDSVIVVQNLHGTLRLSESDIQRLAENRIYLAQQDGRGLSRSRNLGMSLCRGSYIWILDGDVSFRLPVVLELRSMLSSLYGSISALIVSVKASDGNGYLKLFRSNMAVTDIQLIRVLSIGIIVDSSAQFSNNIWFDERLGLGTRYGGTEENDFILRLKRSSASRVASTSLAPLVHTNDPSERSVPTLDVLYARGRIARNLGGILGFVLAGYWMIRFSLRERKIRAAQMILYGYVKGLPS